MIVDFAHNEAGVAAVLDVAEGIAAGAAGRTAPITAIVGTAGDRPDDTLRGIGLIAAKRAQRVAIKETLKYLRGATRSSVVGEILAGIERRRCESARRCPSTSPRPRQSRVPSSNGDRRRRPGRGRRRHGPTARTGDRA